jgi:DNA-binding cell septation regulator SpoVG
MKVSIERKKELNKGSLVAFVDVLLDDALVIKGCKIMRSSNGGEFVAMPAQKNEQDGKWYDHCRFKTRELQDEFGHLVKSAYNGNGGTSSEREEAKQSEADPREIAWEE